MSRCCGRCPRSCRWHRPWPPAVALRNGTDARSELLLDEELLDAFDVYHNEATMTWGGVVASLLALPRRCAPGP